MKIAYGVTINKKEDEKIFYKNLKHFKKINFNLDVIVNTNKKLKKNSFFKIKTIKKVSDMKNSRIALHKELMKIEANAYFVFDSDIDLTSLSFKKINKILYYSNSYEFISLYYKVDPPIPAFYTLSSSLCDFYNFKIGFNLKNKQWFDDSEFNNSFFQIPSKNEKVNDFKKILYGKSFARSIEKFTYKIDEKDTTTGGASIYFNKKILKEEFDWKEFEGKSLTWYDSYRTFELTKKYKFAKVPIFVDHKRHEDSIQLSWESVIRYILGFNFYKKKKEKNWNEEAIIFHTIELYFFLKGILKKILALKNLTIDEIDVIEKIKKFMNKNIYEIIERIKKWK